MHMHDLTDQISQQTILAITEPQSPPNKYKFSKRTLASLKEFRSREMTASNPELVIPLIIGGKEDNGSSTFDVVSATTGKVCWKAASASSEDAIRAVEAAKKAFPSWSKVKPREKQKILFKAADILESRSTEYGNIMQMEMGGAASPVHGFILPTGIAFLRDIASHIPLVTGSVPTVAGEGHSAMIWKEPYGVILGIGPL